MLFKVLISVVFLLSYHADPLVIITKTQLLNVYFCFAVFNWIGLFLEWTEILKDHASITNEIVTRARFGAAKVNVIFLKIFSFTSGTFWGLPTKLPCFFGYRIICIRAVIH